MNVRVNGTRLAGRAVDLADYDVTPEQVAASVRDEAGHVTVECDEPTAAHERVGLVTPETTLRIRPALAAAARSRGRTAPQAERLADAKVALTAVDAPEVDLREARERVADASGEESALRERVAALRGRVEALREVDADRTEVETELRQTTRELSEVETERLAAEQALSRARERAREQRDTLAERLRLEDRVDNLAREARRALAEGLREEFAAAVERVPGTGTVGEKPTTFDGDDVTAALAVARVAALNAPVVLACDRFDSAAAAADVLDAPVVRLQV